MKKNLLLIVIFYFVLIISSYGAASSGSSGSSNYDKGATIIKKGKKLEEKGKIEKISIKKESLMGGMSCGEVSLVPWQILKNSVSHCVTVSDDYISKTVKFLANCKFSDEKIIGGECSTPGIISLVGLCNDVEIRKKIDLNEDSNVLLFGCEGDADEELYQKLLN